MANLHVSLYYLDTIIIIIFYFNGIFLSYQRGHMSPSVETMTLAKKNNKDYIDLLA